MQPQTAPRPPRYNFTFSDESPLPTPLPIGRVQVHRSIQSIRWGDMDALGHVNNTLVFRYMEQARLEWIYALAGHDNPYARGSGPLIVNASCTFLLPLVYPGDFEVTMSLAEPGRTSIGSFYRIVRDDRMFAEGAARMVWVDLASGRPMPLPAAVRALVPTGNADDDAGRDA